MASLVTGQEQPGLELVWFVDRFLGCGRPSPPHKIDVSGISIFYLLVLAVLLPIGTLLQVHCLGLWRPPPRRSYQR